MSIVEQSSTSIQDAKINELRRWCEGMPRLDACLEPWMVDVLNDHTIEVRDLVERYGSPLHVVSPAPLTRNVHLLNDVAADRGIWFQAFFARKANKCLTFVEAANQISAGIDVASEQECRQTLDLGVPPENIICTAAIKSSSLIQLCVKQGATMAIDNFDELKQVIHIASSTDTPVEVALRLSGFRHDGNKLHSRFGFDVDEITMVADTLRESPEAERIRVRGIHFHLDGYCADQRVSAIQQCLPIVDYLRSCGHDIWFLDIGGGLPISYLEDERQWNEFWSTHREALLGNTSPITYRNHGLGLHRTAEGIHGERNTYPYYQSPVREQWFAEILDADSREGISIAAALRDRTLQLRCEPGRSSLAGCGMTIARVEFTKRHHTGDWFNGLSMNRTQCRTGSDDFLVDPIVLPQTEPRESTQRQPIAGYLVGAYCTESELIQLRRLHFPHGISRGDLVVFPNTAGYFMHFLESRSHQFPLAQNVVFNGSPLSPFCLDRIDVPDATIDP
ncbi:Y4yA family PLP-dependent enzyme [Aporhodopirellula aestuarii]|uniref:Y4yA family PLP-dependent enzyme n=1 Tax=Aporhodopirellula aestuarii TaxID=2950107 RepID=A0ABT0TX39_9BACT|nr:Y4yA family PLP-dependent enzyme [Aporhodopirellula aestuarii]MCM2369182.1 Y4yA family PLP-dependent enzyme [Aporhodopirellula aestuarii]